MEKTPKILKLNGKKIYLKDNKMPTLNGKLLFQSNISYQNQKLLKFKNPKPQKKLKDNV